MMDGKWGITRRETGLVEHVCLEHGCGHPNFYSAIRLNNYQRDSNTWFVHGCCGCCIDFDFPGRQMNDTELINRVKEQVKLWEIEEIDTEELGRQMMYSGFDLGINAILAKHDKEKEEK